MNEKKDGFVASAKQVAQYFIRKSSLVEGEDNVQGITNLKLQKLLFYAQAEHLQKRTQPLFEDQISAWKYGPVVSTVYNWLKECGGYNIIDFDVDTKDCEKLKEKTTKFLDKIWDKYSRYSAWYLSGKTHQKGSAWHKIYNGDSQDKVIPLAELKKVQLAEAWSDNG